MVYCGSTFATARLMLASPQMSSDVVDLVRSYLRDIGRVPLLTHEQEITLGRQVQELMSLEELEAELASTLVIVEHKTEANTSLTKQVQQLEETKSELEEIIDENKLE